MQCQFCLKLSFITSFELKKEIVWTVISDENFVLDFIAMAFFLVKFSLIYLKQMTIMIRIIYITLVLRFFFSIILALCVLFWLLSLGLSLIFFISCAFYVLNLGHFFMMGGAWLLNICSSYIFNKVNYFLRWIIASWMWRRLDNSEVVQNMQP